MKIALLVHDYHRHGGHARYVAELAVRLKSLHEVHVFASIWEESDTEKITFHQVPSWRRTALTSILSFCLPVTRMVGNNFDVVHSQGFTGFRQNLVTAHICHRAWYEAMEHHLGKLPLRKKINKWIVCGLERWLFREHRAKAFIAVSQRTKADLHRYHGITNCAVIHHGVDCDKFNPRNKVIFRDSMRTRLGIEPNEIVFLYVGDWQKAGKPLVAALAKCGSGRLLVVSKTKNTDIERDAQATGVFERVILIPGSKEIEKYYSLSDIFVFPSYHDSFGMVVTEAMASGLPVICSGEAGASELVEDGTTGIILKDPWDAENLALHMRCLSENPEMRLAMGQKARFEAEKHTWEKCVSETMKLYRKVGEGW